MSEFVPAIEFMSIDLIVPYSRNAKEHPKDQIALIARQIDEVGFTQPIVVDGQNVVIAGHGRLEAARSLGLVFVPVVKVTHLTEEQVMAYRIADNKVAESQWDLPILAFELGTLERRDFDMTLTGFSMAEARGILSTIAGGPGDVGASPPNEKEGAKELSEGDFQVFQHTCPQCGFGFNGPAKP